MKVLIAGALEPYTNDNEKALCETIEQYYRSQNHMTDLFYLPWEPDFYSTHEQLLAYRLLPTDTTSDILITVGYPAFALQHPRKYSFLFSFFPAFHVQYGTDLGFKEQFFRVSQDQMLVRNLQEAEKVCLGETRKVFAASDFLMENLKALDCEAERFAFTSPLVGSGAPLVEGGSILVQSDLEPPERWDLVLQAAALLKDNAQISIMIPSADPLYEKALHQRIARLQLQERVHVYQRAITQADLQECAGLLSLRRYAEHMPAYMAYGLSMGVPCIVATDGGALCGSEGNHGKTAAVVPDAQAIAQVLQKLSKRVGKRVAVPTAPNKELSNLLEGLVK